MNIIPMKLYTIKNTKLSNSFGENGQKCLHSIGNVSTEIKRVTNMHVETKFRYKLVKINCVVTP